MRIAVMIAACVMVSVATAAGSPRPDAEVTDDVTVSAGASVDTAGAAAASAGASAQIIDPHGQPGVSGNLDIDVERPPALTAPRELLAAPYTAVSGDAFAAAGWAEDDEGGFLWGWPVEVFGSVVVQGGRPRFVIGMEHNVLRRCWYDRAEPACIALARIRVSEIYDELRRCTTFVAYPAPVTGLALGPVRVDVAIGGGQASRGLRAMPEADELRVAV